MRRGGSRFGLTGWFVPTNLKSEIRNPKWKGLPFASDPFVSPLTIDFSSCPQPDHRLGLNFSYDRQIAYLSPALSPSPRLTPVNRFQASHRPFKRRIWDTPKSERCPTGLTNNT